MSDPKKFRATIEFEAYTRAIEDGNLPSLDKRLRQCIETHPTASFPIGTVEVIELTAEGRQPVSVGVPGMAHAFLVSEGVDVAKWVEDVVDRAAGEVIVEGLDAVDRHTIQTPPL